MRLSPGRHRGKEGLHHVRLAPGGVEHFDQRREVGAVAADLEDRLAAIAVERLDHDLAMPGKEGARLVQAARHQRRRHELGIIEHEHLLGCVADAGGIVDHQSPVRDPLEQVGGGDVAEVERRILAHQHDIRLSPRSSFTGSPNAK
jgi:hypothetical protein